MVVMDQQLSIFRKQEKSKSGEESDQAEVRLQLCQAVK